MSEESNKFGAQYDANLYHSFRKDTPKELSENIVAFLKEKISEPLETAVDVGCGNGQSTVVLAPYFKRMYGLDFNEAQIEKARVTRSLPNITYLTSPAEKLPFEDGSVQLLTTATALHWFDLDTFLPEARRVLCVNGVLAVYSYLTMKPLMDDSEKAAEIDELITKFDKVLYPFQVQSKPIARNKYKDVKFPFEEVKRYPDVRCTIEGKLLEIVDYMSSWNSYQCFKRTDIKGAKDLIEFLRKRLYEIASDCNISPEDSITLYRDYCFILCRKTQDGSFV